MILLDTHVWLWMVDDLPSLHSTVRKPIAEAADKRELFLSPISMWEISLKASRRKLDLGMPVRKWLHTAVERSRVLLAPIDVEVACECAALPTDFHGDPADRIIAATARAEGFTLVTHDKTLLQLAKRGYFRALAT
ncbi:MAG: type II toxin-antitoxin system VapC family toxin [Acidobacteria bacterium]|nr:type II toxin-antitoxin system VapC family toxin [Acidobacteriota bacterium]